MTKQELEKLREDVLKKFGAHLKAEAELEEAEADAAEAPGGSVDKRFYENVVKTRREHSEAEAKWRDQYRVFLRRNKSGK